MPWYLAGALVLITAVVLGRLEVTFWRVTAVLLVALYLSLVIAYAHFRPAKWIRSALNREIALPARGDPADLYYRPSPPTLGGDLARPDSGPLLVFSPGPLVAQRHPALPGLRDRGPLPPAGLALRRPQGRRGPAGVPRRPQERLLIPGAGNFSGVPVVRSPARLRWSPLLAYPIVIGAGFSILLLEITAGRLLAPVVGVSLETWTGIIGIVLAGYALGDALGGYLADRIPSPRLLAATLCLGGIGVMATVAGTDMMRGVWLGAPLFARVGVRAPLVLLAPPALLGTVLPIVTRLTLRTTPAPAGAT